MDMLKVWHAVWFCLHVASGHFKEQFGITHRWTAIKVNQFWY